MLPISTLHVPACNIDGVPPYVVIELCIANHSRGDVSIVDPDPDVTNWFDLLYLVAFFSPEHKVELYEALVEVVHTSLQGEGKLHQLHQVLVLVAVLLPGDDGDEDDDNDKGKVHQLHQVLIFMAVNRFHIQVHTSFGLLSFSFEKLGMKRTNIKNTYFQINTNILATNISYGIPYKGV